MKKPNLGKVLTSQVLTYPKFHLGGGHSISKSLQVQKVRQGGNRHLGNFPKFLILKAPLNHLLRCSLFIELFKIPKSVFASVPHCFCNSTFEFFVFFIVIVVIVTRKIETKMKFQFISVLFFRNKEVICLNCSGK